MRFLKHVILACAALCTVVGTSAMAEYPERPVTVVVPFSPGGPTDAIARIVAASLEKQSGQSFIVENVAGAGSTIGTAKVAAAAPDGYTLLWGSSSAMVIAPHLYKSLRYDPFKSFEPIGRVASTPYVLLVNAKSPYQSYADLVAYGKSHPNKLNYASPGAGTSLHLTLELMMGESGFTGTHVPFKGGAPAMMALVGGEVDYLVDVPSAAIPMITAGRVRPLAVTSKERLADLPDVPTLQELGLDGFESLAWFAMFAPAGTPQPVVKKMESMLQQALNDPSVSEVLKKTGFNAEKPDSDALKAIIKNEYARWGKVISEKKLSLE